MSNNTQEIQNLQHQREMNQEQKIELKVVYDDIIDGVYKKGWFEINGEKVHDSGRTEMGATLDILKHLGYDVTFVKSDIVKENKKQYDT